MGVHQHFIGRVQPLAHVEDREVLVRRAASEEVPPAAVRGHADRLDLEELEQPALDPLASGERPDHRLRIGVLGVDPSSRLRCPLVFEPAVRIRQGDAEERVDHAVPAGVWRFGCGRLGGER